MFMKNIWELLNNYYSNDNDYERSCARSSSTQSLLISAEPKETENTGWNNELIFFFHPLGNCIFLSPLCSEPQPSKTKGQLHDAHIYYEEQLLNEKKNLFH